MHAVGGRDSYHSWIERMQEHEDNQAVRGTVQASRHCAGTDQQPADYVL